MDIPIHVVGEVMSQLTEMNPAQIYFALKHHAERAEMTTLV
jgi:hypothetical protein